MPNKITFNIGQGGLGRPLPGEDFISGLIFYTSVTLPSGFSTSSRIKEVFSVTDAEALGITNTHLGETLATSTYTVTNGGTSGNTVNIKVGSLDLGTFTSAGGSTSATATGIAATINSGTAVHGFTAVATNSPAGTLVISAPAGSGLEYNTVAVTTALVGSPLTLAASGTAFSGGVSSTIDIMHYHISEYFRGQPKGDLYVAIYPTSSDFAEITTVQNFSGGKVRQIGLYTQVAFATSMCSAIQTVLSANEGNYKPLEAVLQADFSTVSDLTSLSDLHALTASNVSVCIGQDGAAVGESLWLASGKTVGTVGITLGAIALAKVSDSIAWVAKFNMASTELDTLAFANGTLYNTLSDGTIDNIDGKGYVFLKKHIGLAGSYFDNPYTAIALTSDFCFVQANRTMHKATRGLRSTLLPALASPVQVNADGTLAEEVIGYFKSLATQALDVMLQNQELSAYSVDINPVQNVLSTSTITIVVKLVPVGSANEIVVNIGYAVALK